MRELVQAIRRILLTHHYSGYIAITSPSPEEEFIQGINNGTMKVDELLNRYCNLLYKRFSTYQEVAHRTGLDPRTVKKYLRNSME